VAEVSGFGKVSLANLAVDLAIDATTVEAGGSPSRRCTLPSRIATADEDNGHGL
jgi:hypothetical protein